MRACSAVDLLNTLREVGPPVACSEEGAAHLKNWLGPPCARTARAEDIMVGREAAVHIMLVLMTSSGVVAAAAKAPAAAPMQKSSCRASYPSASAVLLGFTCTPLWGAVHMMGVSTTSITFVATAVEAEVEYAEGLLHMA